MSREELAIAFSKLQKQLEQKDKQLKQKDKQLEQKDKELEQKDKELEQTREEKLIATGRFYSSIDEVWDGRLGRRGWN